MLNEFIMKLAEQELTTQMRMLCILGGSACLISCAFWYGMKMGLKAGKIVLLLLIAYPTLVGLMNGTYLLWAYAADMNLFGMQDSWMSGVTMCLFLPPMSLVFAKVLKIPRALMDDLLPVIRLIEYPLSTLGCTFTGCCPGYPWDYGVYNPIRGTYDFPAQALNALIMVVIVICLLVRAKKRNYRPDGLQMPLMLISMGGTRWLTEYIMDNDKLLWGMSFISICSLIMVFMGVVILLRRKKHTPAEA